MKKTVFSLEKFIIWYKNAFGDVPPDEHWSRDDGLDGTEIVNGYIKGTPYLSTTEDWNVEIEVEENDERN